MAASKSLNASIVGSTSEASNDIADEFGPQMINKLEVILKRGHSLYD